jgi:hypothetical protein
LSQKLNFSESELTFSLSYEQLYKNLLSVHNTAKILDEDTMIEQKIVAYAHVLDIVGQLHSIALGEKEDAYSSRREAEADLYFKYRNGEGADKKKYTQKDAEYMAQKDLIPFRKKESEWIRNLKRWENARTYIHEQVNILKKVQARQHIELNQLNKTRGQA